MVRVAKYLQKEIILLGNEAKNDKPNFFYQEPFAVADPIKVLNIINLKEDTYINTTRQLQKEQEKIDIYFCMRKIKIIIIME